MRRYPRPGQPLPKPAPAPVSPLIDSALTPPRASLAGAAAVRRLAEDMRQAGSREGGVTEADLWLLGWSPEQIAEHVAPAREMAQRLSGASV